MLPRRSSTGDQYTGKAGVHNLSVTGAHGAKESSVLPPAARRCPLSPSLPDGVRMRRRRTEGDVQSSLWRQLGELGKTLAFSEDVVSTLSPHAVSYRHARSTMHDVFRPGADFGHAQQRRKVVRFAHDARGGGGAGGGSGSIPRHDCSAEAKRPIHQQTASTATPSRRSRRTRLANSGVDIKQPAAAGIAPATTTLSTSHTMRLYSNTSDHSVPLVPASSAAVREKRKLLQFSDTNTTRLGEREQGGEEIHAPRQPQHQRREGEWGRREVGGGGEGVMMQDYVTSLQRGAKPVTQPHQGGGRGGGGRRRGGRGGERGKEEEVIILDNNLRYDKFLQTRYPKEPGEWYAEEEEEEEENAHSQPLMYTRGSRRWTRLPQPASVRGYIPQ